MYAKTLLIKKEFFAMNRFTTLVKKSGMVEQHVTLTIAIATLFYTAFTIVISSENIFGLIIMNMFVRQFIMVSVNSIDQPKKNHQVWSIIVEFRPTVTYFKMYSLNYKIIP